MKSAVRSRMLAQALQASVALMFSALLVALLGSHAAALEHAPLARVAVLSADTGKPLPGVWLYAYFVDPATSALRWTDQRGTGSDGRCVLEDGEGFGPGRYVILAWCEGYRDQEHAISWDGRNPVAVSFALKIEKSIADVVVADATTGLPIAEALVDAFFADPVTGDELWAARAQTTRTGGCRIADESVGSAAAEETASVPWYPVRVHSREEQGLSALMTTSHSNRPASERPDRPEEACGVFGVYAPGEDVARLIYFGLHALQHRGQESAGIAVADGHTLTVVKNLGLVPQVFKESDLATLQGHLGIGHTRYSTTGASSRWENAQPMLSSIGPNTIALAHNGNLVNTLELRQQLKGAGFRFRSTTDSEVIASLVDHFTQRHNSIRGGIRETMRLIAGAYSVVLMSEEALYAFRDPHGVRPLVLGTLPGGGWVVASETCALDIVGARYVRDIVPGEMIKIGPNGLESEQAVPEDRHALCIFEFVYFARPDSVLNDCSLYEARVRMGQAMARTAPVEADLVIGVPDTGGPAAVGFANASGIPYAEGLVKNRYVGRTFISPTQSLRQQGIRLKLNPLKHVIAGKRLVVVDDSIVRGNTTRQLVALLKDAGATEVHMRITSPPVRWPCFYGIDTDTQEQLIASDHTVEEIRQHIGADSLAYLSVEDMVAATGRAADEYCLACFTGEYPIDIPESVRRGKFRLEAPVA